MENVMSNIKSGSSQMQAHGRWPCFSQEGQNVGTFGGECCHQKAARRAQCWRLDVFLHRVE